MVLCGRGSVSLLPLEGTVRNTVSISVGVAARAMQIDRRLSLAHQVQLTAKIPMIY